VGRSVGRAGPARPRRECAVAARPHAVGTEQGGIWGIASDAPNPLKPTPRGPATQRDDDRAVLRTDRSTPGYPPSDEWSPTGPPTARKYSSPPKLARNPRPRLRKQRAPALSLSPRAFGRCDAPFGPHRPNDGRPLRVSGAPNWGGLRVAVG
jgi:hypothetical protein